MTAVVEVPRAPTPVDGSAHLAFFYHGRAEYLGGLMPFVQDGLTAGEPVAVAVPRPQLDLVRSELGAGLDGVTLIDMSEQGRNPGRIIPAVLRAFADSHDGPVRIVGEPVWPGRTELEYPACAQHEARINLAFQGRPVSILCPYDADRLEPLALDDARRTHPCLGSAGRGWLDSSAFDPARVIDEYNQPLPMPGGEISSFDFDPTSLAKARRFAGEESTESGLPTERVADVVQAVGELAANSIVHGGGSGTLRSWAESGYVVFEVSDSGHITDPLAGHEPVGTRALHGRGLLLVNLLSDLVRMHTTVSDGTTVRIYFARPGA